LSDALKGKALRLLARREHSRAELARKLASEGSLEEIASVLDQLEQAGLLSDRRFAEALVFSRAARFGAARLRHDLKARGVAEEIIAGALPQDAGAEARAGPRGVAAQVRHGARRPRRLRPPGALPAATRLRNGHHSQGAQGTTRMSLLKVTGLRKKYKSRTVVKDVSFEVKSGEVVGLLGPNGAGKTTCFYMIVGLVGADGGEIAIDGETLTHMPIHRRARLGLSYLPQEISVFRKLNVAENIRAVLELQVLTEEQIDRRLEELLAELHIAHLRENTAISLSGGERRRVEIARALATSPRFILLDEPFAGVDPIAVLDIQKIIRFLKERGIGVLITDHNVRETLGICDHAYIINEGAVLAAGKPEEIVYNESVRKVYLGEHFRL
jgi:lipopolysaccharide export system ATP-binding protein